MKPSTIVSNCSNHDILSIQCLITKSQLHIYGFFFQCSSNWNANAVNCNCSRLGAQLPIDATGNPCGQHVVVCQNLFGVDVSFIDVSLVEV